MKKTLIALFASLTFSFAAYSQPQTVGNDTTEQPQSLFERVEQWYGENMNYVSITALMAAESSILPVPSELVVPPAAYIALTPEKNPNGLNIMLVILFATLGAVIGATVNYYVLGMWLGRSILYRFADSKVGHLLLLSSEKLQKAENYFNAHGKTSTFIGRFIPVVRHLISIPAGFARMNYPQFLLYTALGAGLWNVILAGLGYLAHGQRDFINRYSHEFSYIFLAVGVLFVLYLVFAGIKKKNAKKNVEEMDNLAKK